MRALNTDAPQHSCYPYQDNLANIQACLNYQPVTSILYINVIITSRAAYIDVSFIFRYD